MNNMIFLLRKMYWLLPAVFFANCSSSPEKIIHKVYTIEIKQMKFQPAEITVEKGDTVIWINKDLVAHDVTELPDKSWSSSVLDPNKSWSYVVQQSADYFCSIHQIMKGKIIVQ